MKRVVVLAPVAVVAVLGFFGWAFYASRAFGSWTGGSTFIAGMIVLGLIFTGGLAAALMWLAFYSSRKGYDDTAHHGELISEPPASTSKTPNARSR